MLQDVNFGVNPSVSGSKKSYFLNSQNTKNVKCASRDEYAVAFLSNFSINNNFSHFLHGLLRLFCALIDAQFIVWDIATNSFIHRVKYTIWLDEFFRLTKEKEGWLQSFIPAGKATMRSLSMDTKDNQCVSTSNLLYGSGCVRLLPPEKWFGYPGCRASEMLPAFGQYMRQIHMALNAEDLKLVDEELQSTTDPGLRVAFAVRDVGTTTGMRVISNLQQVQMLIRKTQHVRSSMQNITFEHLDVPSTVRYMAQVHIFVSVHGAGMTNMFFMNPGSAVVEIIPFPLCNCRSPDYFYGTGGYYHGSAIAQDIRHYHYCVPANEVKWHRKPEDIRTGSKCSWKHLHAVESVYIDPSRFVSLMRNVERDLVAAGTILLTRPIINASPHANGR
mmetsp:Transcript_24590/g.35272  ORF Transcript_24590/g.35272 Transcript_24590/m.35272 type:complete len:388 (+) Transcript_24590:379-1542(+)